MKIYAASHLLPVSAPPIAGGAIAIEDGRIVDVGPRNRVIADHAGQVMDFPGCAIIPGFVNTHSHLELSHFPSWKIRKGVDYTPRTYIDWIIQVIKIRRALTLEERELSVAEGVRISLESGTTSIGEILSDRQLLHIYSQSPLHGRIFLEAIGVDPARDEALLASLDESLGQLGGDLQAGISPHAPHTVSEGLFRKLGDLAARRALPLAVHLAESTSELDFLFDSSGPVADKLYPFVGWREYMPSPRRLTSTAYLDGLGLLGSRTLAIHCVHITPADVGMLKSSGVTAVLCPRSNDKLNVGAAPVHLLKKAGIPITLGTDSLASNDSLSMLDEARFFKERFPAEFNAAETLRLITLSGAEALGISHEAGSLEAGKRGNFLVLSLPGNHSGRDIHEMILENSRLQEVFVSGRPLCGLT
jgi:aminodeoxyfutalosine deaminase